MFTRKFLNKFTKYMTTLLIVAGLAAGIATGVGAALGAAGLLGTTAAAGATAIWTAVGGAMASIGSALGISSLFTGLTSALGLTASSAAATAAGISVVTAGAYGVAAVGAGISASREMKHEAKMHQATVERVARQRGVHAPSRDQHVGASQNHYAHAERAENRPAYLNKQGQWANSIKEQRANAQASRSSNAARPPADYNSHAGRVDASRMASMDKQLA